MVQKYPKMDLAEDEMVTHVTDIHMEAAVLNTDGGKF